MGDKLKDYIYKTYLIGSMEVTAEGDTGGAKRKDIEEALLLRSVYPINPCKLEASKTGMITEEVDKKMTELIETDNWSEYKEMSNLIWKGYDGFDEDGNLLQVPGDFDYVEMSNWITFVFSDGDQPCGSFGEAFYAWKLNIPVYLITNIPVRKLRKSLLQCVIGSGGEVFPNQNSYLHFIDNKYNLSKE